MDKESIAALIEKQYAGLRALLRRKLRDDELAQDALNQALVTALEHLQAGRISDPSRIGGYVFQVAMNQMRNHRRKMDERVERRGDSSVVEALPDQQPSPEADLEATSTARVRSVIEALPTPRDREIVRRFYLDEEEKESICHDLQLSQLHFDKVIFRARQRMRALLEASGLRRMDLFCFVFA